MATSAQVRAEVFSPANQAKYVEIMKQQLRFRTPKPEEVTINGEALRMQVSPNELVVLERKK
jgi:hypothetical protein